MHNKISDYYTIFFSFIIIYSIYSIKDFETNIKVCCFLNILKSLNFEKDNILNIIHHIITISLSLLFFNNKIINEKIFNDFQLINKTNISTLFLVLRSMYNNTLLDILFAITFLYFRIKFIYNFFNGSIGNSIEKVCENNYLCISYINVSFYGFSFLNIYWIYLLIHKIIKIYKLDYYYDNFINKYENIFIILVVLQSANYLHYIFSSDFMKENNDIICNENYICQLSFYSFFYTISFFNIYYTIKVLIKKFNIY